MYSIFHPTSPRQCYPSGKAIAASHWSHQASCQNYFRKTDLSNDTALVGVAAAVVGGEDSSVEDLGTDIRGISTVTEC